MQNRELTKTTETHEIQSDQNNSKSKIVQKSIKEITQLQHKSKPYCTRTEEQRTQTGETCETQHELVLKQYEYANK